MKGNPISFLSETVVFCIVRSLVNPLIRTKTQIFASIYPEWPRHFCLRTLGGFGSPMIVQLIDEVHLGNVPRICAEWRIEPCIKDFL